VKLVVTFLIGLVGGIILQHYRWQVEKRSEKKARIIPYAETLHPKLENLVGNALHAVRLQDANDLPERNRYIERVCSDLEAVGLWFLEFVEDGLKPELQDLDLELYANLHGTFVYRQMLKEHGEEYISQNLNGLKEQLLRTLDLLTSFVQS